MTSMNSNHGTLHSFKSSVQVTKNEHRDRQKTISVLNRKLNLLYSVQSDMKKELADAQEKLKSVREAREELTSKTDSKNNSMSVSTEDTKRKAKSFFLVTNVLKRQFNISNASANQLAKFAEDATVQLAESDKKSHILEDRVLNQVQTSRVHDASEKLSEILQLRESNEDSNASLIKSLVSEKDNALKNNVNECEELQTKYSSELNQAIQAHRLFEQNLEEELSTNEKLNEELENSISASELLYSNLEDKLNSLNQLKKSIDDWSKETEIITNQVTEELKTVLESLQEAEENDRIVKEENSNLAKNEQLLLAEKSRFQERLSKEEGILNDLQFRKSSAANSQISLLQAKTNLDQQIENMKKAKLSIDQDCALLEKENASLVAKIQEEATSDKEALTSAKVTLEEVTSQISNLEHDLTSANENHIKLNVEVEKNALLLKENADVKEKYCSLSKIDEDLAKKLEISSLDLKDISNKSKLFNEEVSNKMNKFSSLLKEKETDLEASKNMRTKLDDDIQKMSSTLAEYQNRRRETRLNADESIEKIFAEFSKQEKNINESINDDQEKMDKARKNFNDLYETFSKKYKEKRYRLRTAQVQLANLQEKLEKAKKTKADLNQMLINKLKEEEDELNSSSSAGLGPKRIKFSSDLEKFSPLPPSDAVHLPKSILKRRNGKPSDGSLKRSKTEGNDEKNYFPIFED